jgi:quercetin dioxygenase-like cupin family protein
MTSLQRTIEGDVLVQHLKQDERMIDQALLAKHGRSARTLVKEGPLRLTLMAIGAGGNLPTHRTEGPLSIHILEGTVTFDANGTSYPLAAGDVLVLAAGVEHGARSTTGTLFLLTVVHTPSAGSRLESA